MFIQTESTPNPLTLKFIPDGLVVIEDGNVEFKNQEQASKQSPLAMQLFQIQGVESIFFGKDFIVITKNDKTDWDKINPEIIGVIMDFFMTKKPIMFESFYNKKPCDNSENDSDIVKQIKELIEIKVRPSVAMDGGDIVFHSFENGIVKLVLKGSCSGCPSSMITLKNESVFPCGIVK